MTLAAPICGTGNANRVYLTQGTLRLSEGRLKYDSTRKRCVNWRKEAESYREKQMASAVGRSAGKQALFV